MANAAIKQTLDTEGEKCQTCGSSLKLPFDRFKDELYLNWIKASLCLQLTKEGLEDFVGCVTYDLHKDLKHDISTAKLCPHQCHLIHFTHKTFACKSKKCDALRSALQRESISGHLTLNSVSLDSMATDPAEVAKVYMPTICRNYTGPADADSTAILAFMGECLRSVAKLQNRRLVDEVRNSRNSIMHSGTMRLTHRELKQYTDTFVNLLTDPIYLKKDNNCREAVSKIEKVIGNTVHMDLVTVEQDVLKRHGRHVKSEVDALRAELQMGTCTISELHDMKHVVKKIVESELQRQTVMEVYRMETIDTETTRHEAVTLQEQVEERIQQRAVEEKEQEIKMKAESLQTSQEITKITDDVTELKDTVQYLMKLGISTELSLLSGKQKQMEERQNHAVQKMENMESQITECSKKIEQQAEALDSHKTEVVREVTTKEVTHLEEKVNIKLDEEVTKAQDEKLFTLKGEVASLQQKHVDTEKALEDMRMMISTQKDTEVAPENVHIPYITSECPSGVTEVVRTKEHRGLTARNDYKKFCLLQTHQKEGKR